MNTDYENQLEELNRTFESVRERIQALRQGSGAPLPPSVSEGLQELQSKVEGIARAAENLEAERRNLAALADLGAVINSSLDLTTVLEEVMDTIIRLTGAERSFLMLRGEVGEMEMVVARNWERETVDPEGYAISSTIVGQVLQHGKPVLTTDASADPRYGTQESIIAHNLRSILCVPLKVKGELTGVIYADNRIREGLFTERERSLLSAFANQAAVALENARLFASVQGSLEEVTELKNLMEDVFASIASGVLTADVNDRITLCNRAAEAILAMDRGQILGSRLKELLAPLAPDLAHKVYEVREGNRRYVGLDVQGKIEDRGPVELSLNITPLETTEDQTRGVAIVLEDLTERRRLEAQRRLFSRMVSPAVIEQLDPDALQLGGRRAEITTLFADIRGFTAFSEAMDPEALVEVLNQYLAVAGEAILSEEGTIDKFLGDAVMAWFNAPVPQEDHALRAARAALAMRGALGRLHRSLEPRFHLSLGIGIHTGEALLGLVGTQRRLDYTAIGDSVNTAKRLQQNAAPGQILASAGTADQIQPWVELRPVAPIAAEGKGRPLEACEVVGLL